jgi:hypothetical protein
MDSYRIVASGGNLDWLNPEIEELVELAQGQDDPGIKLKLKEIVPEYQPYEVQEDMKMGR